MKVKAKTAFFDGTILRKKGDEFETKSFDPILMTELEEEKVVIKTTKKSKKKEE